MIRRYHNNRRNDSSSANVPNYSAGPVMVKYKDVLCGFCKHRFYIGKDLQGHNSPLLLPCGHATCSSCESTRPNSPCPQCPHLSGVTVVEKRERLQYNFYVIGLLHAMSSMPLHTIKEPDFSFHVPTNALARQHFAKGPCQECGMIAYCECRSCPALLCKPCHKKIHGKVHSNHEIVFLHMTGYELPVTTSCPNHEEDGQQWVEYYCVDCDFECCSHCLIRQHKEHKSCSVEEMNAGAMPEFDAALEKVNETWRRVRQTKKVGNKQSIAIYKNE